MELMSAVSSGVSTVIGWVARVISALVKDSGTWNALLPLFAIGIAISAILLGIKIVRSVVWGA